MGCVDGQLMGERADEREVQEERVVLGGESGGNVLLRVFGCEICAQETPN